MTKNYLPFVCLFASAIASGADIAVEGGAASFVVSTNVPAISVKGKTTALQAHARVQQSAEGLQLERIEASLPVKSILTGMSIRDEHMRRYIFTTGDGKMPDLRFEAASAACSANLCQVAGTLAIRGVARPFSIPLKLRADGATFHVAGDSVVKLSDYGIEQPSQFGVKTSNDIQLHLEFSAKESLAAVASGGRK
jgi:polyisoprenoid-binding protein YceI